MNSGPGISGPRYISTMMPRITRKRPESLPGREGMPIIMRRWLRHIPGRGIFDSLLPHELGHIIFREFIGPQSNTPYGWMKGWRCIRRKAGGRMLSSSFFRLLKKKVYEPGETIPAEYRFCWGQECGGAVLQWIRKCGGVLINRFGRDNFVKLCKALQERKSFEQAVTESYRVFKNLEELNKNWLKYIKEWLLNVWGCKCNQRFIIIRATFLIMCHC